MKHSCWGQAVPCSKLLHLYGVQNIRGWGPVGIQAEPCPELCSYPFCSPHLHTQRNRFTVWHVACKGELALVITMRIKELCLPQPDYEGLLPLKLLDLVNLSLIYKLLITQWLPALWKNRMVLIYACDTSHSCQQWLAELAGAFFIRRMYCMPQAQLCLCQTTSLICGYPSFYTQCPFLFPILIPCLDTNS